MPRNDQVALWSFPGFHREPGDRPLMMGIVNVTPDSFSDGGAVCCRRSRRSNRRCG